MQSILLHIQDDDDLDYRIDAAVAVADTFDGHITCLHAMPCVEYLADSGDAGGAILKIAEDVGATLLVMGAYGHSRTAEFLLGGATQAVLSHSSIPLLLAH